MARPASPRPRDPLAFERGFWGRGLVRVAGVDEVGRGPLAGPVVAAAVILPPGERIEGLDDSKKLSPALRETLALEVRRRCVRLGVGAASPREVDALNVRRATALAMRRAIARLGAAPDHLLVDGLPVPELGRERQTALVGGDARCHSIAAASVVAKTVRDLLMRRLALRWPGYGWERNMGYPTPEHREALVRLGPTPHHRRSFAPVQLVLPDL